jgi:hypothetical protein
LYNFERNQLTDEKENFETENKEVAKDTNNKICIENRDISKVKQKEKYVVPNQTKNTFLYQ